MNLDFEGLFFFLIFLVSLFLVLLVLLDSQFIALPKFIVAIVYKIFLVIDDIFVLLQRFLKFFVLSSEFEILSVSNEVEALPFVHNKFNIVLQIPCKYFVIIVYFLFREKQFLFDQFLNKRIDICFQKERIF